MAGQEAVREAEKAIARILKELEESTGQLVESISIEEIEVTKIKDDRRMLNNRVLIETIRLPGHRWMD